MRVDHDLWIATMRKVMLICVFLLVLALPGLRAQTPDNVTGTFILDTSQVLDAPKARVLITTEQPHRPRSPQEHPLNRVMVFMGDGQMTLTTSDGKVDKWEFKDGDAKWFPAGSPYISENTTDHPFKILQIELKDETPGPRPVPKLDAAKVDPSHNKLVFENDQVQVIHIRYAPHEQGSFHEHIGNRVVYHMTDSPKVKAGEISYGHAEAHKEGNDLDVVAERIAVSLK